MISKDRIAITIACYCLAFYLVYAATIIDPTNMAGPGLDLIVYPLVYLWSLILVIKYFIEALKDGPKYLLILVIHLAGFIGLILFLKEIEVRPIF